MKKILLLVLVLLNYNYVSSQDSIHELNMTNQLRKMTSGWTLGNEMGPRDEPNNYFEIVYYGDWDMNHQDVQIFNTVITVVGDTINSGKISKRYRGISDMKVLGKGSREYIKSRKTQIITFSPKINRLTVVGNDMKLITIHNSSGKLVSMFYVNYNRVIINLKNYNRGIYYLEIILFDGTKINKNLLVK